MVKIKLLLFGLIFMTTIADNNAYSLSVTKPISSYELLKYANAGEVVKLSYKQFTTLTGQKTNLWHKLSFDLIKMKVKNDLKKHRQSSTIFRYSNSPFLKILFWILIGLFALLGLFFIIYGFAPR